MKIEVNQLVKAYGEKRALDGISFAISEPKIYGLLGRNGAGKTTFMEILAGQVPETGGSILVEGKKPFDNQAVISDVCLIKEGGNFKAELKIKQLLKVCSFFYPKWDQQLAEELIQTFSLSLNAKVKTLSKGMESALGITVGLASKAPITVFDEPYIGMDAAARKSFYEILLKEYDKAPRMIIFSTHLIDEAALLFEEVLIFDQGKLVMQEETDRLREETCSVTGTVKQVQDFTAGKKVLMKKQLAGMMTAYVYANEREADACGLQVEGIPIQELMIYLTGHKTEGAL